MSETVVHALAGAGGGMISMAMTYPLINVSTRSQVDSTSSSSKSSQWDIAKNILKNEGISGLYSGMKSAIIGIAVAQAVYYYWYEAIKEILIKKNVSMKMMGKSLSVGQSVMTGGIAGSITAVLTNPIWVINTRLLVKSDNSVEMGSDKKKRIGMKEAAKTIYRQDGILGFWRGVIPALALVSNPIIQYTVFERLKSMWEKKRGELTSFHFFILGAVSKLCATGITYPYIVIKSRMHVSKSTSKQPSQPLQPLQSSQQPQQQTQQQTQQPSTIISSFNQIIQQEGLAGLYKGISSKLIQSVLTSAIMFGAKEELFRIVMALLVMLKGRPLKK